MFLLEVQVKLRESDCRVFLRMAAEREYDDRESRLVGCEEQRSMEGGANSTGVRAWRVVRIRLV